MTLQPVSDDISGTTLFPEYSTLYDLVVSEVAGLTDEQLDFESERWGWSKWSIRRQLRHMAGVPFSWLVVRWGKKLFPEGDPRVQRFRRQAGSGFDRIDMNRYQEMPIVLAMLREAIDLTRSVLAERSIGFLRHQMYLNEDSPQWNQTPEWKLMELAHPSGLGVMGDPPKTFMTLEASIRHVYFEETTHLYNIQRLKRAQGLHAVAKLPRLGYWVVNGWDVSEAQ